MLTEDWMHFVIILLLFVIYGIPALAQPLLLTDSIANEKLGKRLQYTVSSNGQTLEQVKTTTFEACNDTNLNLGFIEGVLWAKFEVENPSSKYFTLFLEFDDAFIPNIETFVENRDVIISTKTFSVEEPAYALEVKSLTPIFKLSLPPGPSTVWMKLPGVPKRLRPQVWSEKIFLHDKNDQFFVLVMQSAIPLCLVIYHLVVYLANRKTIYLRYIQFVAMFGSILWIHNGILRFVAPSSWNLSFFFTQGIYLCYGAAGITIVRFFQEYVQIEIHRPSYNFVLTKLVQISKAFWVLSIFLPLGAYAPINLTILGCCILFSMPSFYYFRHLRPIQLMSIGSIPIVLYTFYGIGTLVGLSNRYYSDNVLMLTETIFLLLLGSSINRQVLEIERRLTTELEREHEKVMDLNRNLEARVEERTADITAILDNIDLGIFTIKPDGKIHKEHSHALERIFECSEIAEKDPVRLLHHKDCDAADIDKNAIACILGEPPLGFELNKGNLSREIVLKGHNSSKHLELSWSAIERNSTVERLLVTVKDVTEERNLKADAELKDQQVVILKELIIAPSSTVARFFYNARVLIAESRETVSQGESDDENTIRALFINAHTFKGMARSLNLRQLKDAIHCYENILSDARDKVVRLDKSKIQEALDVVIAIFNQYTYVFENVLGRKDDYLSKPDVSSDEISSVVEIIDRSFIDVNFTAQQELDIKKIKAWLISKIYTPGKDFAFEFSDLIRALAKDLEKEMPYVEVFDNGLCAKEKGKQVLSNILVHLLRNSMDHGIEAPRIRIPRGKDPRGKISIYMRRERDSVCIEYMDDGQGLDLKSIERTLISKGLHGLANRSTDEKARLVFEPGFSTSEKVTDISGRGVGMDAIRSLIEREGGTIDIQLFEGIDNSSFVQFKVLFSLPYQYFYQMELQKNQPLKVS